MKIVKDVFEPYELKLTNLQGQCYDGASNVSGRISGLQARIRTEENRALHVHGTAHRVNLVVQDAIEDISVANNFLGIAKDLINFMRDSPKRLAEFQGFQIAVAAEMVQPSLHFVQQDGVCVLDRWRQLWIGRITWQFCISLRLKMKTV